MVTYIHTDLSKKSIYATEEVKDKIAPAVEGIRHEPPGIL